MRASRIATLVAFVGIAVIVLLAALGRGHAGTIAPEIVPEDPTSSTRFIVRSAPRGDALHRGDRIEIVDRATIAALLLGALRPGTNVSIVRRSPLPRRTISEPVVGRAIHVVEYFVFPIGAFFVAIAFLIAARGRSPGSLQLAWLFAILVLLFNPTTFWWPRWLVMVYAIAGATLASTALVCAADFASRFVGDPQASWARRYRAISLAIGLVAIVACTAISVSGFVSPRTPVGQQLLLIGLLVGQAILFIVGLALAFVRVPPVDRQRIVWIVGSLGLGIVGFVATIVLGVASVAEPLRDVPLILLVAMPIGSAYAILRYRLLDIAFVINRATVFGITSLTVLGGLALIDYGLQTYLGSWFRETGIVVQLGLALAIGLSTRPIHERIDALVDDLFFRERHEAERTLRDFARDVVYIDDPDVVIERAVATIASASGLSCSIYLASSETYRCVASSDRDYASRSVDRNDEAVVRVLATRDHAHLGDVRSALPGDFVVPMFARNRLLGFVVCGTVGGVAASVPDELVAIGAAARATGLALDLLRIEALERELANLRAAADLTTLVP